MAGEAKNQPSAREDLETQISNYKRWIKNEGPHSRLGKFYRRMRDDLGKQLSLVNEIVFGVEQDISRMQHVLTHTSRVAELSKTLEALRDLKNTIQPHYDSGKINFRYAEPVIIPVVTPDVKRSEAAKRAVGDPRTQVAEEWLNAKMVAAMLQELGVPPNPLLHYFADPTGRQLGKPLVDSLSGIGGMMFDTLRGFDEYATLIGRPLEKVRAINLSELGMDVILVQGGEFDPKIEFAAQLSDLDQFRMGRLRLVNQDIADEPRLKTAVQSLMEGVIQAPLFPPPPTKLVAPR